MLGWTYPAGVTSTPYDEFAPENCPVCGKDNWDPIQENLIHKSGVYCSDACEEKDVKIMREADEAEAAYWEQMKSYEEELEALRDKEGWR